MPIISQRKTSRSTTSPDTEIPLAAAELADAIGVDATRAGHLLAAVWEMIENYAPGAPDAIKREAIIRAAGWLHEAPSGGQRMESVGEVRVSYSVAMSTGALRSSGAMALLSPWKVRRAGAIG